MKLFILANKIKIISAVVVVLLIGGIFIIKSGDEENNSDTSIVSLGRVVQEISVSGRVKPAGGANLAFEDSGRIRNINSKIGDTVAVGQILASLENGSAYANLLQAEADLKAQEANLLSIKNGATTEELAVLVAKLNASEVSLYDSKQNLLDKIKDAYTKGDDAIRNKADQFFSNPKTVSVTFNLPSSQSELVRKIEIDRSGIETVLNNWSTLISNLNIEGDLENIASVSRGNLNILSEFADSLALVVNALEPSSNFSASTIDGYKADVSLLRSNINTAIANLSTATEKYRASETSLLVAQRNLDLERAGSSAEQIAIESAKVEKYKANLLKYEADYLRTLIRAPFRGVITSVDGNVGEIVSGNVPIISIISEARFEIESNIPEADVINLEKGDLAIVTLDAYGKGEVFEATIISISQSEKVVDGIPTYKTTFQFKENDPRIKSGMSADLSITTDIKEDVISIPQRAIIFEDGGKYVRKISGESFEKVSIETGLEGSDGNIEIISGINVGEEIVVFFRD